MKLIILCLHCKKSYSSSFMFIFWDNQQKRLDNRFPMVLSKNMCDIDFFFTNEHAKKLLEWSHDFPNRRYIFTLSVLSINNRLHIFWQSQIIPIVMDKNLYMVFMCIIRLFIDVMPENARKGLKKHACWKHYSLSYYSKKYYLKPKRIKTGHISFFFVLRVCRPWCCQF